MIRIIIDGKAYKSESINRCHSSQLIGELLNDHLKMEVDVNDYKVLREYKLDEYMHSGELNNSTFHVIHKDETKYLKKKYLKNPTDFHMKKIYKPTREIGEFIFALDFVSSMSYNDDGLFTEIELDINGNIRISANKTKTKSFEESLYQEMFFDKDGFYIYSKEN